MSKDACVPIFRGQAFFLALQGILGQRPPRKRGIDMAWMYEARMYDNRSLANYVAMCVRDDQMMSGKRDPLVQIYRTRRGKYGVKYKLQ
jgi:hypothetical protein